MQAALADAQSAAGDPVAARATLLDALRVAEGAERFGLTVAASYAESVVTVWGVRRRCGAGVL